MDDHKADTPGASTPSDSDIEVVPGTINEKRLLRNLDLRLLPAVSILYLLSFLDRSNVANARIEGLITDLHMTGNEYLTGLTLYFVGYVLFELVGFGCQVVWNAQVTQRAAMQYHIETDDSKILAADFDRRLGNCRDSDGCNAEQGWVFCCALFVSWVMNYDMSRN